MIDKKQIPYQVKSNGSAVKEVDTANRIIKAIANTYNFYDSDGDVLRPGAAARSIIERGAKSNANDKIKHALFHDLTKLVGRSLVEEETVIDGEEVLYVESYLAETSDGEDTLIKYQTGIYNQHSIGFRYMHIDYIEREAEGWANFINTISNPEDAEANGFGWEVKEINWYEWSTVAFGANKLTPYLGTKTMNRLVHYDTITKKLNALLYKANRLDIKDKKLFDMQFKQLQQMIYELSIHEPSKKVLPASNVNNDDCVTFLENLNI